MWSNHKTAIIIFYYYSVSLAWFPYLFQTNFILFLLIFMGDSTKSQNEALFAFENLTAVHPRWYNQTNKMSILDFLR